MKTDPTYLNAAVTCLSPWQTLYENEVPIPSPDHEGGPFIDPSGREGRLPVL